MVLQEIQKITTMERNIAALFERGSLYLKRQEEPTVYNRAYSTETSEERN